jgi:hypothetical protein
MELECEPCFVAKKPEARQHFFMWFPGFIGRVNKWQAFSPNFSDTNLKLARFPQLLAATRRGLTFYVADLSVPFTNPQG